MKKCLIVVDYQIDFIHGSLGFKKAASLAEGIKQKIDSFHQENQPVIFTLDTHDDTYLTSREGVHLSIPHCIKGTPGHALHPLIEASIQEQDLLYEKTTFGSLSLANDLRQQAIDQIEIVGLVTHICVLSNAILLQAALPQARIIIHPSLCASFDDTLHQQALSLLRALHFEMGE